MHFLTYQHKRSPNLTRSKRVTKSTFYKAQYSIYKHNTLSYPTGKCQARFYRIGRKISVKYYENIAPPATKWVHNTHYRTTVSCELIEVAIVGLEDNSLQCRPSIKKRTDRWPYLLYCWRTRTAGIFAAEDLDESCFLAAGKKVCRGKRMEYFV